MRTETPLLAQVVHLARDVLLQQAHQRVDLAGGTLPVLLAEREQAEHADAGVEAALDHLAHGAACRRGGRAAAAAPGPWPTGRCRP